MNCNELCVKLEECFCNVYHVIGKSFSKEFYLKVLEFEFTRQNISYSFNLDGKVLSGQGEAVFYKPDFLVEDKIVIEFKALPALSLVFEKDLLKYLNGSNFQFGYFVNFGNHDITIKKLSRTK